MVSKASEDLPEPLSPVITVRVLRGISTLMFFRLCWRAPRTRIEVIAIRRVQPYRRLRWAEGTTIRPYLSCQHRAASMRVKVAFPRGRQMFEPAMRRARGKPPRARHYLRNLSGFSHLAHNRRRDPKPE